MVEIRPASDADFDCLWPVIQETFASGETYPFPPDTTREEGYRIWMKAPRATYVALWDGKIAGTYYLKPNQPGLGAHVCNAGYIVHSASRGRGIGRRMCEHSLSEARKLGFKAMQFNLVVATNTHAIRIYLDCGFQIVGRLPQAFASPTKGLVDALVMYQWLG